MVCSNNETRSQFEEMKSQSQLLEIRWLLDFSTLLYVTKTRKKKKKKSKQKKTKKNKNKQKAGRKEKQT